MSKPVKIKMLLLIIGLPIFVLIICGYYINKLENEKKAFLHAFVVANIGLMQQKVNLEEKTISTLVEFDNQVVISRGDLKAKNYNDQAIAVHRLSNGINNYIEQMKVDLVVYTDGCSLDKAKERVLHPFMIRRKSDYVKTTRFLGTNKDAGQTGKAHDLKLKLADYKTSLIAFIKTPNSISKNIVTKNLSILDLELPLEYRGKEYETTWEMFYFYKLPQSAALTELTKWQNNVRDVETTILVFLFDQLSLPEVSIDKATR